MTKNITENVVEKKIYTKLLSHIRNLPSIPVVMFEVSKMLSSPRTSASDLGRIISQDQGLVAKVLTVANSPLYGLPRRVSTIEFAIVILGFEQIKSIVMALSMVEVFKKNAGHNWDNNSYWNHTIMTATAAKRIADEFGYPKPGEVFTAGLLHDLGIAIIQRHFSEEFNSICSLVEEQQINFLEAEEQILGLNHQEIGMLLCNKWNLPESLGDTIAHHHNPSQSENNKLISSFVHLADYMTQKLQIGNFYWDDNMVLDDSILDTLRFDTEEKLNEYINKHADLFKEQLETAINI